MSMLKNTLILTLLLSPFYLFSQSPGDLDTTFGKPLRENFYLSGGNSFIHDLIIQPDNKLLIAGGGFGFKSGRSQMHVTRLNTDDTFDSTGFSGPDFYINSHNQDGAMVLQPDGKIILGSRFSDTASIYRNVFRLNSDRTLDSTFYRGNFDGSMIYDLALQPDGKILVSGSFTTFDGVTNRNLLRLNNDGTIDTSFLKSGPNDLVYALAYDSSNNRILIGGDFVQYNFNFKMRIAALNLDGTVDTSFHATGFTSMVRKIVIDNNGKILVGGHFGLERLNSDGSDDPTFVQGSGFAGGDIYDIKVLSNNRILVAGDFNAYNGITQGSICRLYDNGSYDSGFYSNASYDIQLLPLIKSLAIQADGKIICGGDFYYYGPFYREDIMRLLPDGYVDRSFISDYGFLYTASSLSNLVYSTSVQPDGKVLFGGSFNEYDKEEYQCLVRVDSTGIVDTSFARHSFVASSGTETIFHIVPDNTLGKVYLNGNFEYIDGISLNRFARLNWNGGIDTTFHFLDSQAYISHIAIQQDGKLIVVGNPLNGNFACIARINSDGSYDATFNAGTGFGGDVPNDLLIQPDGKIVLCGDFTAYNGTAANGIIRLNSDGSVDNTFNIQSGVNGSPKFVSVAPNGNIFLLGRMSNYSGNAINNIVSIKPNGDYDNTFLPPTNWINSGNTVYGNMYVQNDGRVIVAAPLYIAGTKNLIRFNTDGSIDSTFRQAPSNLNVYCIERYDDNRLVFGNSTQYNGYTVNGIMRVYNNDISNEVKLLTNSPAFLVYPNPVQSNLYINSADLIGMEISVKIYNVLGDLVMTKENLSMHSGDAVINVSSLSSGLFFLSINCGQKTITSKFQKFD